MVTVGMRKVSNFMAFSFWSLLVFLPILFGNLILVGGEKKSRDGKIATALEEYHSTIKCVINIAEETLPELDDFVACCGFWAIHGWLINKVEDECEAKNLDQVKHVSGLLTPHIRNQCTAYEEGSFTCRLFVIMPFAFVLLFIIFLISLCVCSCVSFGKWTRARTKYHDARTRNSILRNYSLSEPILKKIPPL